MSLSYVSLRSADGDPGGIETISARGYVAGDWLTRNIFSSLQFVAMVGSSFSHLPARIMIEANCLSALRLFYYAKLGRFGGTPYRELQRNLSDADLNVLRDVKVMILEENESFVARAGYVDQLRAVVSRP